VEALYVSEPNSDGVIEKRLDMNQLCPVDERTYVYETTTDSEGNERLIKTYSTLEKHGFDGYAHCVEVWGTKWGACRPEIIRTKPNVFIYFESAWSPANGLVRAISTKFPTLVFGMYYTEEADFYSGIELFQNGKLVATHDTGTVDCTEEEQWLNEQQKKAEESGQEMPETVWHEFYEKCSEKSLARDEKLESLFVKSMNDFGKNYSSRPPKAQVKHKAPF
jgi:hypothetical protein